MFLAAAMTRAVDFINSDESSTGDILILRAIDDMDDLESTIENDIADNKETYGETAEFGLWSHGGTHGPFKYNENGKLDQLNIDKWSKIDFNWGLLIKSANIFNFEKLSYYKYTLNGIVILYY